MDIHVLGMIVVRASVVYAFLFLVVRAMGKRKLGAHSALDLVIAVLLADVASQAIFGSISLAYGLFALLVVAGWHYAGHYFAARDTGWVRRLAPEATVLIRDGEVLTEALRAERLSDAESMVAVASTRRRKAGGGAIGHPGANWSVERGAAGVGRELPKATCG